MLSVLLYFGLFLAGFCLSFAVWVLLLPWSIRPLCRFMLWPRYSIRATGIQNVPHSGPVMLVANHVTWIDGFVIASVYPRPITVLVNKDYCDNPGQRWISRRMNIIPIPHIGPKSQRFALEKMREALDQGKTVGLFPEAQLSRSGVMNPFQRGMELILKDKPDVVVIPIGLAGLWGSIFSFSGGLFFKKWPKGLRRKVGVSFGKPLAFNIKAIDLRQQILLEIVKATELIDTNPLVTEVIDLELGHWRHPDLGILTASAPDFIQENRKIYQIANKPGSVGQVLPGIALRVVNESGEDLGYSQSGKIQARVLHRPEWIETGEIGKIEPDGFVWLANPQHGHTVKLSRKIVRTNGVSTISEINPDNPEKNDNSNIDGVGERG
jgi:1-acyl-sn-glycerol-3-phosphate acyltransferase